MRCRGELACLIGIDGILHLYYLDVDVLFLLVIGLGLVNFLKINCFRLGGSDALTLPHGPSNEISFANSFQSGCFCWIADTGVYKTDGLLYGWELRQIVYNMFELFRAQFYGGVGLFVGCFVR